MVQSESLGRAADLGFSAEQIRDAKETLRDFVSRLREKLNKDKGGDELGVLVARILEGQDQLSEWLEELAKLETEAGQPAPLPLASIPTLEAVLAILDGY